MGFMKLAYLILAHHQPMLLARLVDRLLERGVHRRARRYPAFSRSLLRP
jgi:archaellum biogenesis protein FlaJ (TadC family)